MTTPLWQQDVPIPGDENTLLAAVNEMRKEVHAILKRLDQMDNRHKAMEEAQAKLQDAFPEGNTEGHRRFHELQIQRLAELRSLRIAIQEKTISGLLWSAVVFLAMAAWTYLKKALGSL